MEECADARNEPIEAKLIAACADGGRVNITPEKWERVRSLLDSYANALVAAAGEACAKHVPIIEQGIHVRLKVPANWLACSCGQLIVTGEKKFDELWADHLRSAVTPESAARELERIKMDARQEGMKREIAAQMAHVKDYPNLGDCEWNCTTADPLQALLEKIGIGRIKAEARLEEHVLDCLHCRCCDSCRKLCQRRSALEAAKEK